MQEETWHPRRIENGCGFDSSEKYRSLTYRFQYPRRIENGCGARQVIQPLANDRLSVSSADRERLRRKVYSAKYVVRGYFQYPRRIENGCGLYLDTFNILFFTNFQYPRRIENGCGSIKAAEIFEL